MFIHAILEEDVDTVKKMLADGMIPLDTRYFMNACRAGNVEIANLLMKWRGKRGEQIDVRKPDQLPIIAAMNGGFDKLVNALLNWRSDAGEQIMVTSFLLEEACRSGHVEMVRLLLAWRGPAGEQVMVTNHCMTIAVSMEYEDIVWLLLSWRGPRGEKASTHHLFYDGELNIRTSEKIHELLLLPTTYHSFKETLRKVEYYDQHKQVYEQKLQDYVLSLIAYIDLLDDAEKAELYPLMEKYGLLRNMDRAILGKLFGSKFMARRRATQRSTRRSTRRSKKRSARRSKKRSTRRSKKRSTRRSKKRSARR